MKKTALSFGSLALFLASAAVVPSAQAVPLFTITSQLTGDIRPDNPDNLFVDVSIVVDDATPTQATWTIDINSPAHPGIKLDEFYFNLAGLASSYSFSGFDPSGWAIATPASVQGAGGASFMFEALDPAGPPNAADVTNSQNLTFVMTYALGSLTDAVFLGAPVANANDAGSGQLGAHLQSLTTAGNCAPGVACSDSGFAFGSYEGDDGGGGGGGGGIPEPATLALLGAGLLGLAWMRRWQPA